jgi:Glycosyltransferase family 87
LNAVASPRPTGHRANIPAAIIVSVSLTALVLLVLLPNLWYGLHDISDIPVYQAYSQRIAHGERPFTPSFEVEYPPLAIPFFRLPGHADDLAAYTHWFSIDMGIITMLAAAIAALTACRFWPRGGRAYVAAVLFPVGVALIGAIIVNRYDAAVALLIAIFLLCLSARWLTAAAFVLGMGFALKFTPAAMLPLVIILAGRPRRWVWPLVAFGAAAAAPFLPYLFSSPRGLWYVFQYHLERPLQIESVLGTPMLFGKLIGVSQAAWGYSHGSHTLVAKGAGLAANLSGALTVLAVAGIYWLVWRRRARLRAVPPDQAIAVLALVLALMTFGKVLSPQYFIWTLPAWALVAARDRILAVLGGVVLLLTQVEFPAHYWQFLDMQPMPVATVVTRNTLLVVFFAFAAWRLWRLPETPTASPR